MAEALPISIRTTHPTSGLAGYPAYDWPAEAGTVVGAPTSGTIERTRPYRALTEPGGAYGRSIYFKSESGSRAYLTHFQDLFVQPGQEVQAGTPLGTVHDYGDADHIHYGIQSDRPVGETISIGNKPGSGAWAASGEASQAGAFGKGVGVGNAIDDTIGTAKSTVAAAKSVGELIEWLTKVKNLQRVGEVLAGAFLIGAGVVMLGKSAPTGPSQSVGSSGVTAVRGTARVARRAYG